MLRLKALHSLYSVGGQQDVESGAFERPRSQATYGIFIVDEQNAGAIVDDRFGRAVFWVGRRESHTGVSIPESAFGKGLPPWKIQDNTRRNPAFRPARRVNCLWRKRPGSTNMNALEV